MIKLLRNLRILIPLLALSLTHVHVTAEADPQYGGHLNIGLGGGIVQSWDPADWPAGVANEVREKLFAGDLDKSIKKGGPYSFVVNAYLPTGAIRGELAESWRWTAPLTLEIKLREGVMFPDKPGMMQSRELVADDIAFTFKYLNESPRRYPVLFDHIDSVVAVDDHTVVFHFKFYSADWALNFGYGFFDGIVPQEIANIDATDWKTVTGTGPFMLHDYVHGHARTLRKNPNYWDREKLNNQTWTIPFVDKLSYRVIKDESTRLTALRTGQIDILPSIRWIVVDHLKKTTPELQWNRRLALSGMFITMRMDKKPFDDTRVRRAMNLAVNQQEIVDLFYNGHAELMAYPQNPDFGKYFQPLAEMPASVQELFEYKPEKAKQLLAAAGYPNGFAFDMQVCGNCEPSMIELLPLLVSYLEAVGIRVNIQPIEAGAFTSMMRTRTHPAGSLRMFGQFSPIAVLRSNFFTKYPWNGSMYSDPVFDAKIRQIYQTRDEDDRIAGVRELTVQLLDNAPYVWLPTAYFYTAWWPWVKNYNGELYAGAGRGGPIYARIWIDQKMKQDMGFE